MIAAGDGSDMTERKRFIVVVENRGIAEKMDRGNKKRRGPSTPLLKACKSLRGQWDAHV